MSFNRYWKKRGLGVVLLLIVVHFFNSPENAYADPLGLPNPIDYVLIYYTNPKVKFTSPITRATIKSSEHKLLISNKRHIKWIVEILKKVKKGGGKYNGMLSIYFGITVSDEKWNSTSLYIDNKGNFIWDDKEIAGSFSKEVLDELVSFCENLIGSSDLYYLDERLLDPKGFNLLK